MKLSPTQNIAIKIIIAMILRVKKFDRIAVPCCSFDEDSLRVLYVFYLSVN